MKINKKLSYIIPSLIYIFALLIIGFRGEFPINDDWLFYRQILAFRNGITSINAKIDPSFIFQGILGLFWTNIFGLSFKSLRILTTLMTLFSAYSLFLVLKQLNVKEKIASLAIFSLYFNAIIFSSSLTFMTDNYFLVLIGFSIYFYLKSIRDKKLSFLVWGSIFCGLSILVRQIGVLVFFSYIATLLFTKKLTLKKLLASSFFILLSFIIYSSWPRYGESTFFSNFIEPKNFFSRLKTLMLIFPTIIFFLSPLIVSRVRFDLFGKQKALFKLIVTFILGSAIYKKDLFPIGGVFYIEGLHAKTGFKSNLSLFDNISVKYILALYIAFCTIQFIFMIIQLFFLKRNDQKVFLRLNALSFLGILIISTDLYDRYALPIFFVLLALISIYYKESKIDLKKRSYIAAGLIFIVSTFLTIEYMTVERLKWDQAQKLSKERGLVTQIQVSDTYTKYVYAQKLNDFTGLEGSKPGGLEYVCYVQQYVLDGEGFIYNNIQKNEDKLDKYFDNPVIYERKKLDNQKRIKKHLPELIYNEQYFSPIYSIIGRSSYVGSWCE